MFGFDERETTFIYPRYKSEFAFDKTINLLYVEENEKFHYILIKDLESLIRKKTKYDKSQASCQNCLRRFSSVALLVKHCNWGFCYNNNKQIETMPEGSVLKFNMNNFKYRQPNTLTVYAGTINYFYGKDD